MRKMLFGAVPRVLVLLTVLVWSIAAAKEDPANPSKRDNSLDKTTGTPLARPLNINNFVTWMFGRQKDFIGMHGLPFWKIEKKIFPSLSQLI